jgi:hypothetical protein
MGYLYAQRLERGTVGLAAGADEVVEAMHGVAGRGKLARERGANEAADAGDEDGGFHKGGGRVSSPYALS